MARKKKELDVEVSLIAFISLLPVLICSLLLSATWIQIGSVDVKQAVGGQAAENTEKKPSLWARFEAKGGVVFQVEDSAKVPRKLRRIQIANEAGQLNMTAIEDHIRTLRELEPALHAALIYPDANTIYDDIIALMDRLRDRGVKDLGVAPL